VTLWEGGTDGGNRAASAGWSGRHAQSFQLVGVSPHRASDKRRREKIDVFGGEGFAKAEVVFARTRVVEKNFLRNRRFSTHAISLEKRTISFFGNNGAAPLLPRKLLVRFTPFVVSRRFTPPLPATY
jgi:hypothetical protein